MNKQAYFKMMRLHKYAKQPKQEVDLGDGYYMQISSPQDRARAQRIKANSAPMGFGGALADSALISLLAAAASGAGTLALNRGEAPQAALGAALAGGGITALWNGLSNMNKRKMSVQDAINKELE